MKNTKQFFTLTAIAVLIIIFSCQKEVNNSLPTKVTVYLTDHQTPVFDSVFIDIQKLEVKPDDDTLAHGGWVELTIRPGVYNILKFRNGIDTLFATGILPNNRIKKIRLTLGDQNSVMRDNQRFPLRLKMMTGKL